jgi:hypothetical protein
MYLTPDVRLMFAEEVEKYLARRFPSVDTTLLKADELLALFENEKLKQLNSIDCTVDDNQSAA